jgi:hypothetical protein
MTRNWRINLMRTIFQRVAAALTAAVGITSLSVVVPTAANAQPTAALPILLPSPVPVGFSIVSADQESNSAGSLATTYVYFATDSPGVLSSGALSKRSVTISASAAPTGARESLKSLASGGDFKSVKVGKNPGIARTRNGVGSIQWIDGRLLVSLTHVAPKVTLTGLKALALTVKPTRQADSSFRLTKQPGGVAQRYAGSFTGLLSGETWEATYKSTSGDSFDVSGIAADPLLLDFVLAGDTLPSTGIEVVSVRGKQGVRFGDSIIWEESPKALLSIDSDELSTAAMIDIATTLQPVDAETWQAARDQARLAVASTDPDRPADSGPVLAAGMVGLSPWTVTGVGSSLGSAETCTQFRIGEVVSNVCATTNVIAGGGVWKSTVVGDRRTVFGLASSSAATAVLKDRSGTELARSAVVAVPSKNMSVFVFQVGEPGTLTPVADGAAALVLLDASGTAIGQPIPVTP